MERDDLVKELKELIAKCEIYYDKPFAIDGDPDDWHRKADGLLLKYIDDEEISELFDKIEKWYS